MLRSDILPGSSHFWRHLYYLQKNRTPSKFDPFAAKLCQAEDIAPTLMKRLTYLGSLFFAKHPWTSSKANPSSSSLHHTLEMIRFFFSLTLPQPTERLCHHKQQSLLILSVFVKRAHVAFYQDWEVRVGDGGSGSEFKNRSRSRTIRQRWSWSRSRLFLTTLNKSLSWNRSSSLIFLRTLSF